LQAELIAVYLLYSSKSMVFLEGISSSQALKLECAHIMSYSNHISSPNTPQYRTLFMVATELWIIWHHHCSFPCFLDYFWIPSARICILYWQRHYLLLNCCILNNWTNASKWLINKYLLSEWVSVLWTSWNQIVNSSLHELKKEHIW
jgi:hypothetical protein